MMTSLGTCRFVMPRSESTMAIAGPASNVAEMSDSMAARSSAESFPIRATRSPKPLVTSTPSSPKASPCFSKRLAKNASTACPKMIGSDTFIIVAFRCSEKRTPASRAASICDERKASNARLHMNVASSTSPSCSANPSLSTVMAPSVASNSIRAVHAVAIVTDCSL